jgi:hypothetical protein
MPKISPRRSDARRVEVRILSEVAISNVGREIGDGESDAVSGVDDQSGPTVEAR